MIGTTAGRHVSGFGKIMRRFLAWEDGGTAADMTGDREDGRILDVDGYVHVIDGRILCFERHMFDLSSDGDREVLFSIARRMDGGDGVRVLVDPGDGSGNYMAETRDIGSFPESLQAAIRAARRCRGG